MKNKDLPQGVRSVLLDRLDGAMLRGTMKRRQFITWSLALGVSLKAAAALADTLEAARANQDAKAASLPAETDVIICGGGTSGCTLAGRLAEAGVNVVLLEAGDWDTAPSVQDPGQWFMNLGTERDWGDVAVATTSVNGRAIPSHMGHVLGGGSSINATIWVRPTRADLDGWADMAGDTGWGYDAGLESFGASRTGKAPTAPIVARAARSGCNRRKTRCPSRPRCWRPRATLA